MSDPQIVDAKLQNFEPGSLVVIALTPRTSQSSVVRCLVRVTQIHPFFIAGEYRGEVCYTLEGHWTEADKEAGRVLHIWFTGEVTIDIGLVVVWPIHRVQHLETYIPPPNNPVTDEDLQQK